MMFPKARRLAPGLTAFSAALAFAACSGANGSAVPQPAHDAAAGVHATSTRLAYVSDYSANVVYVYNYPGGTPSATIGGLSNPQGLCVDAADHHLFVTNTGGQNVLEYAWGATSPGATYGDAGESPIACSVDPSTGKLAIADIFSPSTGVGAVTICSSPARCKVDVQPAGITEVAAIAYVPNGDLYIGGLTSSSGSELAYLAAGTTTWRTVSVKGLPQGFGAIQGWDGKYLALAAGGGSGKLDVYRCAAKGSTLSCGQRPVVLTPGDAGPIFFKYGGQGIVAASNGKHEVYTWAYPAGGNPTKAFQIVRYTYSTLAGAAVLRRP